MSFQLELTKYSTIIDNELKKVFLKQQNFELYKASNHLLQAGGKRLRSVLLLLISESICGKFNHAIVSAISIELLHTFTLVHDDIMDHSSIRRNVTTVNKLWGEANAILTGDTLYLKTIEILTKYNDYNNGIEVKQEIILKIIQEIVIAGIKICEGQWLDLSFSNNINVTEDQYLDMITKKTAVLFGTSAKIAGLLNGMKESDLNKLYNFGISIGKAYQLQDDILDITDTKKSGKSQYSDIKEWKMTLLMIHAFKNGVNIDYFGSKLLTSSQIKDVIQKLIVSKSIEYVKKME